MAMMVAGALPAVADTADSGRAFSYGINAALAGNAVLDQTPNCEAGIPPGLEDFCNETLVEVPVEGVVESGTLVAENQVLAAGGLEGRLQQERVDFAGAGIPSDWNSVSYAVTEALRVVDGLVSADVIESESVAGCVAGQPVFGSGANVGNLSLADLEILGELLDLLEIDLSPVLNLTQAPNTQVIDLAPLVRITFWETNWDGATGTTDGSDTVWTNALRIRVLEGIGDLDPGLLDDLLGLDILDDLLGGLLGTGDPDNGDGPLDGLPIQVQQTDSTLDVIVSHSEASVNCDRDPLADISKTATQDTVAPGDTFTYNINVPNSDDSCTLTNVRVVDTITGPAGFQIVSTTPEADSIDMDTTTATITWNDIGPIAPGDAVPMSIGVRVPDNAPDQSQFSEQLRVTALCDDLEVDGGLDFTGPTVSAPPPAGPPLPVTGGAALLGGLAFMTFGAGLLRLRR